MVVTRLQRDHARQEETIAINTCHRAHDAFVTTRNSHARLNVMQRTQTVSNAFKRMAELRAICDQELTELCANYPEISLAVVATADARLISMRSSLAKEGHRIAAMTGSMLGLCETLARELSAGSCQSAVVSMTDYTCIFVRIADPRHPLALAIGVGHNIMLALSRRVATDLATRIASHIQNLP